MKYKHLIIAICLYYSCISRIFGQVHENAVPFSVTENLPTITSFEDLHSIDSSLCKDEYPHNVTKFACPIYTDLDPHNSGQWIETPSGRVWRLGISSTNAFSLYIHMRYKLASGAKMFVYGPEYRDLRGAFTNRNNNSAEVLTIAPIRGDRLIIELNLPNYLPSYGEIKINKVYHDFLNIYHEPAIQGRRSSGCEEDINCENGRYWQTEKRSVCKIISNGGMGTGTLIGNTGGSITPYVLSANHLISSAEIAAEAIFIFNYETTGCDENITSIDESLSGAALISTTDHRVDFTLMKLYERPPPSYRPFYAGWDARNTAAKQGVCIHHPFGAEKQIAIEYHPIVNEDIGEGFDSNSTWKVSHWELGTTEPGSSGAPLFNESHRIVGTLTGGRSTCGYPRDDYFTKFGVSWDAYPDPSNQLKYWLDSAQTGQIILDGYDPYGFNVEYCDTSWNFYAYDKLGLSNEGLAWGWVTGHSSAGYTQFAERFESAGTLQVNGMYLNVAKAYSSNPFANIELKVWEGDRFPENERYSKLMFIKDFQPNKVNYVAFDSVLQTEGPMYLGYKINYNTVLDTFALYHALDRGHNRPSSMYLYDNGWYQSKESSVLGISTSIGVGVSECYGKTRKPTVSQLNLYPNPSSNYITLDLPGNMPILKVKCFDSSGRPMSVYLSQTEVSNKLYFDLKPGVYLLRIVTTEKVFSGRFVVM